MFYFAFTDLFGSVKSKTPIFSSHIPAFGASNPCMTPVSEAKATTEATTFPYLFGSDKSKASMFGASKPAFGASVPCMTPLSEAKSTTEATTSPSPPPAPCSGPKQPPPLTFLNVHCRGIKVSKDGSTVTRFNAECGTVYSARPVHVYERICLRFLEVTDTSSRITAGFTNCDPSTSITSSTPKWSLSLEADFCTKGTIFCYYVDVSGVVHFEINGKYRGVLLDGVDTSNHLWMRLYINKFGTEVELLDPRNQANGETIDSHLEAQGMISEMNVDDLPTPFRSVPLPLHKIKGTNVQTNEFGEAARLDSEIKHGYVFIAHLLKLSYTIHIQILQTETAYSGSLAIGITTCNPDNLNPSDLPEDPRLLLRRPEYCVVSSDVASGMKRGDYLEVTLMTSGEVQVGRNGSPKETIMHVINSLPLWMFVNIYGATQKIRVIHPLDSLAPHNIPYECTLKRPPPLTFHNDPDMKDIRVSKDGFKVISLDKKCGSVYSARPVNINEKVYLRFLEVNSFDPNIMAGFMNRDPMSLATNFTWESVEIWNTHLKAKFYTKSTVLSYSVDLAGVVSFYNDGKFGGLLFKGVDTCNPFWMSLNISKTETVVQFVEPQNFGQERRIKTRRSSRYMRSSMNTLAVDNYPTPFCSETLPLHKTKSSNIQTNEFGEAARCGSEINYGYAFTDQPIQISNTIYIQILQTEKDCSKSLAIGVTSCNPEYLTPSDLREDPKLLSQQPEDWEVIRDVANDMKRGEYLEVTLRANGDFEVGRNGSRPLTHMFVNNIQPLWLFVNIYGATQKIRLLSRLNPFVFERPPRLKFLEQKHDEGIRIHEDGFTVVKLFCSKFGRAYSARPVGVNEKICLRFLELYRNPRIFIGFITRHKRDLRLFAQSMEWCKMLEPEICTIGATFSYYFDTAGVVHFEINDEYMGNWFRRVDPKESLWACLDIKSLGIVMRFVNPCNLVYNQSIEYSPIPIPSNLTPVNLHRTKGRNIKVNDNGEAERLDFNYGYVFTAEPMELEQPIFIQILETETAYTRNLAIGLTSRDPATLDPDGLPGDSNLLYGHPDYFVVHNNKTMRDIKRSDELVLTVTLNGEVQLRRNDEPFRTLQQIDHSVPLWAFVNVYRATRKVRLLTSRLPAGNSPPQPSVSGVSPTRTTVPSLVASENTEPLSIDSKRPDPSTSIAQDVVKVDQVGAECIVCNEESVNIVKFNNGRTIPAFGLGTWKSKPGEVTQAVKDAIDIGYRHIDCAFVYGNEKEVGEAITAKIKEGVVKRQVICLSDLFLTSKLWNTFHRPDLVREALQKSLSNLNVEYLDLYLIHWPQAYKEDGEIFPTDSSGKIAFSDVDYVDTWKALELLVGEGLVRSIGVSNFNSKQLSRILEVATIKPVTNQVSYDGRTINYYNLRSPDRPWAKPGEPLLMEDPKLKAIADRLGKTVAQILIRYQLDRGNVVIPKSVTKSRIASNFDVFDFKLSKEDVDLIDSFDCNGRFVPMTASLGHKDHPFENDEF
ncbi:hypothetical protein K1T71_014381 [Dendrolimus kikuchii]|uniref:Uncharacterized protein n=1 Tax=Dendrolimus kikuchii TaxID=765133 RepID=A0ACC1CDP7_9NEOP|nr:hypothetical protein K1T71_014381 [Dendrolimus kikuchii]